MPPQSPNPNFDFMLKDQQPAKRGLPLPGLNLPKTVKIIILAVVGIILLIIVSSILRGGGNSSTDAIEGVLARGQEMLRVTQLVQQQQLQDPDTEALAATAANSLTSDQTQMESYLARNHVKVSKTELAADTDSSTDAAMQAASQNNNLDGAYAAYMKNALSQYETDLQNAYKLAGPNGKLLLSNAFNGAQAMLTTQPIKS